MFKVPDYIVDILGGTAGDTTAQVNSQWGNSALFTYNSDKWLVRNEDNTVKTYSSTDVNEVARQCEHLDVTQTLLRDVARFVSDLQCRYTSMTAFAYAIELCPTTLVDSGHARLHLHLFVYSDLRHRFSITDFTFLQIRPYWHRTLWGESLLRHRNRWSAFFYVAVQKKGYVAGAASHTAFRDYGVQVQWIFNLYQASKISADYAKRLVSNIPGRAQHAVSEIDFCEGRRISAAVADLQAAAEATLRRSLLPFRHVPEVDVWQQQYQTDAHRYSFLVLEGPSCTGKTQFARSLCPSGKRVFEINCGADAEPALQGFNPIEYGLVLFDEVRPATVARQRKLFQAGLAEIQLGCSATNAYMYKVCVYKTRLVCCSNDWSQYLRELDASSRQWILNNSVHVPCMQPMWLAA